MTARYLLIVSSVALFAACGAKKSPVTHTLESETKPAETAKVAATAGAESLIDAEGFMARIRTLSSDEFEGRAPGTPGGRKTIEYLEQEFRKVGAKPGNGASYFQDVPLVTITAAPADLNISGDGIEPYSIKYGDHSVVWTKRVTESITLEPSEIVFVGYGIVAPEYNWNDYEKADIKGKTALILVNDPGYPSQNPDLFNGNAMTYYGRWTYKYEEAARQGAAAAIVVHEEAPAGYPWAVVQGGWTGPKHDLVAKDKNFSRVQVEGWIDHQRALELFEKAGHNYDTAKAAAMKSGFEAVSLGLHAATRLDNTIETNKSQNVMAVVPGAKRPDEYIVYMAHWDHLGINSELEGDQIFNGAVDNATGTAGLLELAEAFLALDPPPERSVLLLAVTAEESGLLGSKHYGENPIYPLKQTVAGINMDAMNVGGRTRDVAVIGYGSSELENYLKEAAVEQHRSIEPEPTPEKGFFYRSDHFNLAKKGVPMIYAKGGIDFRNGGVEAGREFAAHHIANYYHKPSDEIDERWDISGAIEDLQLYFAVGKRIAYEESFPEWYPGNEFRAIREASMQ